MRIAIDVSPLAQTRAGTARYLNGLIRELERRDDVTVSARSFGGKSRLSTLARDGIWYPFLIGREGAADVLHCPTYRGPLRSRVPLVVTVHDLAVLRHPEAFNRWTRTYSPHVVPTVLRAARRVIAVSDFTRRELIELLGVPDEKIRVVPNAVGDEFTREGPAEAGDYVLAVGTLEPRKNLERLVEAVGTTDRELRVVGARGWGGVEVRGNGVRWLGEVGDAELARLYRGAVCVAYPSLYEGFGIPVLEAMACGAPVVTTRGTAMEEGADGAAATDAVAQPPCGAPAIERAAAGLRSRRGRAPDLASRRRCEDPLRLLGARAEAA